MATSKKPAAKSAAKTAPKKAKEKEAVEEVKEEKVEETVVEPTPVPQPEVVSNQVNSEKKVLSPEERDEYFQKRKAKFADVGHILGIVGFVTSFIILGVTPAAAGIVFSSLGMKATDPEVKAKAKKGLGLSIAGCAVGAVVYIVLYVVLTILGYWPK